MASEPTRDMSEYPRPWFYRPEIYYGFIIFPPVWSVLTLRSPWNSGEGFRGILVGGMAWFFLIASVVLSVRWVQNGGAVNLFIFVPGILLTVVTQVQWAAHRAYFGPPPTELKDSSPDPAPVAVEPAEDTDASRAEDGEGEDTSTEQRAEGGYSTRRRRRRRRRPIDRSADSGTLC